jgi:hypothetical protein
MFSAIRRRLTYANVAMTLALVFAMSGGAWAAGKFVITSTKQIKPSVLKQFAGKTGPAGPAGAPGKDGAPGVNGKDGLNGVNGKDGVAGSDGKEGAQGKEGKEGKAGKDGAEGKEGSPWTAGGTLPSGKTETGTFSGVTNAKKEAYFPISFAIPLSAEVDEAHSHIVKEEEAAPAACEDASHPGTAGPSNPEATSGNLCIYLSYAAESTNQVIEQSGKLGIIGASTSGAFFVIGNALADEFAVGTWAVTG